MKKNLFIPKLCSISLTFILAQGVSYAMPVYARFRQRFGYGASKGVEQSRRENQFDRGPKAGFIQYLTKPVNMDALYEAIDGI